MTKGRYWALFLGIVLFSGLLHASSHYQSHVHIQLASSVKEPSMKEPFWTAVQLKIDPGWHINGRESGEEGNPLTLNWSLPKGLKILETVWPEPKLVKHGSVSSYIYEKEVWVLIKMEADAAFEQDKIGLNIKWVACGNSCMLGNSHLELKFPAKKS